MYKMNGEFLISGKFQIVVYSLCNFFVCSLFTLFYTKNDFRSKFKAKKWIKVEKYENHEIHRKYTGNVKNNVKQMNYTWYFEIFISILLNISLFHISKENFSFLAVKFQTN